MICTSHLLPRQSAKQPPNPTGPFEPPCGRLFKERRGEGEEGASRSPRRRTYAVTAQCVPAAACTPPAGVHWSPIPRPRALAVCGCVCLCVYLCTSMSLSLSLSTPFLSRLLLQPSTPACKQPRGQEPCRRYGALVALPARLHACPAALFAWEAVGEIGGRQVVTGLYFRFHPR